MKVSRKDFQALAGCTNANISTYAKRGQIIIETDENGKQEINTDRNVNKDFLTRRAAAGKGTYSVVVNMEPPTPEPKKAPTPKPKPTPEEKKAKEAKEKKQESKYDLDLEKTRAEIDKKYIDTELAKQKLSILAGTNIPVELVKSIFAVLGKSLLQNYNAYLETEINEICHAHKIKDTDRVKILQRNVKGLNAIHGKAIRDSKTQMRNALSDTKFKSSMKEDKEDD